MVYKDPFSLEQYLNKTAAGTLKIWCHTTCEVWYCCVVQQKILETLPSSNNSTKMFSGHSFFTNHMKSWS